MAALRWVVAALTQPSIFRRVIAAYAVYVGLVLTSFAIGALGLPRGALRGSPITALGSVAAAQEGVWRTALTIASINLALAFVLGAALNMQRVRGFPAGYVFLFVAAIASGLVAGSDSFITRVVSPYTVEGWLVALRIQHLELLGYTVVVAATVSLGAVDYSSWLPWRARETHIRSLRDLRLTRAKLGGVAFGTGLILAAAFNEAVIGVA